MVRSRAARGGADVASVARFADSAAGELERTAELVDALLALARPLAAPVDLWSALRPLVALHNALAAAGAGVHADAGGGADAEGSVTLEPREGESLEVTADPTVARITLAAALDAAASARLPARVRCSVRRHDGQGMLVELHCREPVLAVTGAMSRLLESEGIGLESTSVGIMIFFSARGRDSTTST